MWQELSIENLFLEVDRQFLPKYTIIEKGGYYELFRIEKDVYFEIGKYEKEWDAENDRSVLSRIALSVYSNLYG